jgi:chromosome segregation ATPase
LKLETLEENLSAVARKCQRDFEELEREKSECWVLRDQLNTRVAHFASSEGREKRMREELEWEIKRLKTLIEAERRSYENRITIGEDDLEEARQRHRSELTGLAESLESVESQRDAATGELQLLRREVETQEKEFALQRAGHLKEIEFLQGQQDLLVKEKLSLQETHESLAKEKDSFEERYGTLSKEKKLLHMELTRATERAKEAETLLLEYRGEKITETNERKKMKILMTRLEEHSAALEKKEEETKNQQLTFETANEEYKENLKDLLIKVCLNIVVRCLLA